MSLDNIKLHKIIRLPFFERPDGLTSETKIDKIKKNIGLVRAVPTRGMLTHDPESNVHWQLDMKGRYYCPGSSNCVNSECKAHGIYVSSKCLAFEGKYKRIEELSVSEWSSVVEYLCERMRQGKTWIEKDEYGNAKRELCLCVKMDKMSIRCTSEYVLRKLADTEMYTFDKPDPDELEYAGRIGDKVDCFMLPNLGGIYDWTPCCFTWRELAKPVVVNYSQFEDKLKFVFAALYFMQNSGEETATEIIELLKNVKSYHKIISLKDVGVLDFIKSAIEYVNTECVFEKGKNFSIEICADIRRAMAINSP